MNSKPNNSDSEKELLDQTPPEKKADEDKVRVKTWKIVVGIVFVLLVVLVTGALHSTFVVGIAINKLEQTVPGLDIKNVSGSIADGLALDGSFSYQQNSYIISGLELNLRLKCLLRLNVCIDSLSIDEITIALQSSAEEKPREAIVLPTVELPVDIVLDSLSIGALSIVMDEQAIYSIRQIQTSLSLTKSQLNIPSFTATDDYCAWQLQTILTLHESYPIKSTLSCQSQQQLGSVNAVLSQSIENLNIVAKVDAQYPQVSSGGNFTVDLSIEPLQPALPAKATISLQQPTAIKLSANEENTDQVTLTKADINIDSSNLNADIALTSELTFSRWPGNHQLTAFTQINSSEQNLNVNSVEWQLPAGKVSLNGALNWIQGLHWSGPLTWEEIDLDYWQQTVSGKLSGEIETAVDYTEQNLIADLDIATIAGTINGQTVNGGGHLHLDDRLLTIDTVSIAVDKSLVFVDGSASMDQLNVKTRVEIPELDHWLAEAGGSIFSNLQVQGSPTNPKIQGQINSKKITYRGFAIEAIDADVNWLAMESGQNRVDILAKNVQQKEFYGDVSFNWQGSLADHHWQLDSQGLGQQEDKKLSTRCSGSWSTPIINTHCDQIDLSFNYYDNKEQWQLSSPLDFSLNTQAQQLSLSAFCLSNQEQSICNNNSVNLTPQSTDIAKLQAKNLSVAWIRPWLPQNASIDGTWNAAITLENPFGEPIVTASLDSDTISLQWRQGKQPPATLRLQSFDANWVWQQQQKQHQFSWQLATQNNGSTSGDVTLIGDQISGELNLQQWQLSAFSRFILQQPRDRIEGLVNSNFRLSGSLDKPLINGGMTVESGRVNTTILPVPIEDIAIDLKIKDNNAKLNGSFIASQSPGTLGGTMFWSPADWNAEFSLSAKDLAIQPDSNIQVFVSPDVQLKLSPLQIALTGTVQVPKAEVEIEELPEQAVSVSSDTIIVGDEAKAKEQQRVTTNLKLVLGDDVNFTGFGLETRITGNLNIQQQPGELIRGQGVLQLKEGRYKAYGQDLVIRNGDLVFVNDIDNPQLRMEAIREPLKTADDVIVGLRVSGAARDPKVALFSEPGLAQQVQLSYMMNGTAPGVENETDPTQLAAQSALSYALNSSAGEGLTQFAGKALGVDDLKVSTDSNENGTQIGLSGYLTPNLLVRYGVGVFDSVNSLTLKYRLKKNLYLKAVSGSSNALDILWSFEKD